MTVLDPWRTLARDGRERADCRDAQRLPLLDCSGWSWAEVESLAAVVEALGSLKSRPTPSRSTTAQRAIVADGVPVAHGRDNSHHVALDVDSTPLDDSRLIPTTAHRANRGRRAK